jgi:hypothetical protein
MGNGWLMRRKLAQGGRVPCVRQRATPEWLYNDRPKSEERKCHTGLTTLAKPVINVDNLDWGWTVIITNPSKGRFGTVWLARRGMARHDGQGKARQGEIGWQMRVTQDALFRLAGGVTAAKGQNAPRAFLKGT